MLKPPNILYFVFYISDDEIYDEYGKHVIYYQEFIAPFLQFYLFLCHNITTEKYFIAIIVHCVIFLTPCGPQLLTKIKCLMSTFIFEMVLELAIM